MFTDLESEFPSVVSQVYFKDQQGVEALKTVKNRLPSQLPLELRQGKILKSSEAVIIREPRPPLLTDAITIEHETFHEAQGLSFPLITPSTKYVTVFTWRRTRHVVRENSASPVWVGPV
jgi:hypothetical protein